MTDEELAKATAQAKRVEELSEALREIAEKHPETTCATIALRALRLDKDGVG